MLISSVSRSVFLSWHTSLASRKIRSQKLLAHKTPIWPLLTGITDLMKHGNEGAGAHSSQWQTCLTSRTVRRLLRRIHQRHSNTAKSKCGLSSYRTSQNNSTNIILTKKSDRFWPFFWPWPWPDPPPQYPSARVLGTACGCDFRGVTMQVDLTSWLDKLSLVT